MSQQDEDMRCEIALNHMEAFIDDELPTEFALGLRRHLEGCPSCTQELNDARRFCVALRGLPELDAPERLIDEVRREVGVESRSRSTIRGRRTRLVALAATILISVFGGIALRQHNQDLASQALKNATEIEYALARVGEITRRANLSATMRVMHGAAVSTAVDGVARTINLSSSLLPSVVPPTDPQPSEGTS